MLTHTERPVKLLRACARFGGFARYVNGYVVCLAGGAEDNEYVFLLYYGSRAPAQRRSRASHTTEPA